MGVQGVNVSTTEGKLVPASTIVATFTDTNPGAAITDFTAVINWGDGTVSPGTISQVGGSSTQFEVTPTGGHTYAEEGMYPITVLISNQTASTPTIAAAGSTVNGKTLPQYSAEWWQKMFSLPVNINPLFDSTGANAQQGDNGDAFFLAGLIGQTGNPLDATATRTITIAQGEPIFFPILNAESDNTTFNPPGQAPPNPPLTFAQLQAAAAGFLNNVIAISASIDGVAIPEATLLGHREISPSFSFTLPDNNIEQFFGYTNLGAGKPGGGRRRLHGDHRLGRRIGGFGRHDQCGRGGWVHGRRQSYLHRRADGAVHDHRAGE